MIDFIRSVFVLAGLAMAGSALAHGGVRTEPASPRYIEFPDTAQYQTLVVDLHTHSVFSDGHVWPTVRIGEAMRDGLDAIAITEHLEYQPHITDIPHPDRNRSFEEAQRAAQGHDLLVIPGVEITRQGEPGHINAVFVKDANSLVKQRNAQTYMPEHMFATRAEAEAFAARSSETYRGAHQIEHEGKTVWLPYADDDTYFSLANYGVATTVAAREVLQAANDQGAFTFWNHPSFATVDEPLNDFHKSAVKDKLVHGVEIANDDRYYPNAHRLALKHNLALIGVSDVHGLIAWDYRPDAKDNPGHRPVTLVLAESDSLDGIRDGLFARRTVVWWKETLIGRPEHLGALLQAIVRVKDVVVESWGIRVRLHNRSDAPLLLRNDHGLAMTVHANLIELAPHAETDVTIRMDQPTADAQLKFTVLNALVAPDEAAVITLSKAKS